MAHLGAKRLYEWLIAPRSTDEDVQRREFILNVILCGVIVLVGLLDIYVFRYSVAKETAGRWVPFVAFSALFLSFIGLLYASRRGFWKPASYLLICLYTAGSTYSLYKWGFDLPQAILGYVSVIIISSILIGTHFGLVVTTILCTITLTIGSLQARNLIDTQYYWRHQVPDIDDPIEQSAVFLLISTLSWLSNREISRSLKRARDSEAALREERDSLEIRVQKRTEELREAQAEKVAQLYRFAEFGRLATGIFHDLINPLTAISLNVNALSLDDPKKIEQTKQFVNKAVSASMRMEQLLHTAQKQIDRGVGEEEFEVNEEIGEVLTLLQYKARTAGVEIGFQPKNRVVLRGNVTRFHQIMANLVSNAIDAHEHIIRSDKKVCISVRYEARDICIEVADRGSGIPKEVVGKIFEPFFSTRLNSGGKGIGLATVKECIEQDFHGTISFRNNVEGGTVFSVYLPRTRPLEKHSPRAAS